MGTVKSHVRSIPLETKIQILEDRIRGFEERYRCPSEQMARKVGTGEVDETAEICAWLTEHSILLHLRELRGHTSGTATTTIS